LAAQIAHAEEFCSVDGPDAVKLAVTKGFIFDAKPEGAGSCVRSKNSFVVTAADTATDGVTCKIRWFAGRKLQHGWTYQSVTFVGADWSFVASPKVGSDDPEIDIAVTAQTHYVTIILKALQLSGGACNEWKLAF
jgi:hypothetical protein